MWLQYLYGERDHEDPSPLCLRVVRREGIHEERHDDHRECEHQRDVPRHKVAEILI